MTPDAHEVELEKNLDDLFYPEFDKLTPVELVSPVSAKLPEVN